MAKPLRKTHYRTIGKRNAGTGSLWISPKSVSPLCKTRNNPSMLRNSGRRTDSVGNITSHYHWDRKQKVQYNDMTNRV